MAEHTIETRILLRYDTLTNWNKSEVILKSGEAAIAVIPRVNNIAGTDTHPENTPPAVGIKIGDGYNYFSDLPWVQGIAADVYNWAKQSTKPTYDASEITNLDTYIAAHSGGSGGGSGGSTTIQAKEYQLIRGTGDNIDKYYLQSRTTADGNWTIDTTHYIDLHDLSEISTWIGSAIEDYWTLDGYVNDKINTKLGNIDYSDTNDYESVVMAVSQTNGLINVQKSVLNMDMIDGVVQVTHGGTGLKRLEPDEVLIGNGVNTIKTKPISDTVIDNTNLVTGHAVVSYVEAATAGLTGAMHYIGEANADMSNSNGKSINPQINGYNFSNAQLGDVVTYDAKEYVWEGSYWRLLGDEGSYAVKGSITDADIADNASINISKIRNLQTTLENKVDVIEGKSLTSNDFTDEYKIKLDGIEDQAQHNLIEHIFINDVERIPQTIEGQPNSISFRMSSLTPEEEEKLTGIEANAQENRIEHIFLNETELQVKTVRELPKSVNIDLSDITEKLDTIEEGAEVNSIQTVYLNNQLQQPDQDRKVNIIIDPAAVSFTVVEGAVVPDGNDTEDIELNGNRKLKFARIAKTGRIYDIQETTAADAEDYLILRCGDASHLIN